MNADELMKRSEKPEKIGMVWMTTSPPCVMDYHGDLLEIKRIEDGLYGIRIKVDSVRGKKPDNYNSLQPGDVLTLYFGPQASIGFYNDRNDGYRLHRKSMRYMRKTFGKKWWMNKRNSG